MEELKENIESYIQNEDNPVIIENNITKPYKKFILKKNKTIYKLKSKQPKPTTIKRSKTYFLRKDSF